MSERRLAPLVLIAAAIAALVWASSPWHAGYTSFVGTELGRQIGPFHLRHDVVGWVDDGLMALFFLVIGLEVKRELVVGELRDRRAAALPIVAAVGGMVLPALLFAAVLRGGDGAHGWGVPMATDVVFALGVVALLGPRVPTPLRVFLLTLAVVDDVGAIVVIALVYSDALHVAWLLAALAVVGVVALLRRLGLAHPAAYVVAGVVLWACAQESGVHPTLAGVAMGLLAPVHPGADGGPSVADRVQALLHPWTSYVVVPLFALVNAGIRLRADQLTTAEPVTIGVLVGLVVGKPVGVAGSAWLAARLKLGHLPRDTTWVQLVGVAMLAGIGFTVSLFVAGLAFDAPGLASDAKTGILGGSVLAAALGSAVLVRAARRERPAYS